MTKAKWEIFTHGGRKPTGIDAIEWVKRMVSFGAGEILLTSMDRDGTKSGFDLELNREVSRAVQVPLTRMVYGKSSAFGRWCVGG